MLRLLRATLRAIPLYAGLALVAPALLAATPPGVLIIGQVAEPQSLDPQVTTAANDSRSLVNLYDGLVRNAPGSLAIEPALPRRSELSADGLRYTSHLRAGAKFHDGTPVDAAAVRLTFERMLNKQPPHYPPGPFPLSFFCSSIQKIDTPDAATVVFTLDKAFAPLLANLATPTGLIVSPTAVKKYDRDFGRHPVGSGAFRFGDWRANQRVLLNANAGYWDGAPKLQAAVFRPITDGSTRTADMLSGRLAVMVEVPPDTVARLARDPQFRLQQAVGPHVWFVWLNNREKPFDDVRVRQAVNYAVNKQSLVDKVLQGAAQVADGPIPSAFSWARNDAVQPYPYDPDKARALLKAAGAAGAGWGGAERAGALDGAGKARGAPATARSTSWASQWATGAGTRPSMGLRQSKRAPLAASA